MGSNGGGTEQSGLTIVKGEFGVRDFAVASGIQRGLDAQRDSGNPPTATAYERVGHSL